MGGNGFLVSNAPKEAKKGLFVISEKESYLYCNFSFFQH